MTSIGSNLERAFSLEGKVAIVTGAASGIGAGIAEMLVEAGATVVIADRDEGGANRVADALRGAGHRAAAVTIDMADEASIVAGCAAVTASHGAPWILVNNAGIQDRERLLDGTAKEWDRTHSINARGPFFLIREVARAMVDAGLGGRIVNISSLGVWYPMVVGLAAYSASKGALLALTQNAAFELAEHGITANAILPGGVATPGAMNARGPSDPGPGRREGPFGWCEPRDMAAAVLFFASPAAHRITNQTLAVDAGFSLT